MPYLSVVGLCAACRHARVVKSARGSVFLLCELSQTDPAFPKYPSLPVFMCAGYEPAESEPNEPQGDPNAASQLGP